MLIVISPSKGQDFTGEVEYKKVTIPGLLEHSKILIKDLKKYDTVKIQNLMQVSENIARLNTARFKEFKTPFNHKNAKPAFFAFKGDVYSGFAKEKYKAADLDYAQKHLRIISGLYGLLRPMDLIQPYRLEMKTRLKNPRGDNLYQFWGSIITNELNTALTKHKQKYLVNLASNEYFKSVKPKELKADILNINFKEIKNDKARVVAVFAKRARGLMSDYILRNRIQSPEDIKKIKTAGYKYSQEQSNANNLVFTRPQP